MPLFLCTYRDLPSIKRQVSVGQDALEGFGRILVDFGVCREYGAWLIHGHVPATDGSAMVHRYPEPDKEICRMEHIEGLREISPSHFTFENGQLTACEFEVGCGSRTPGEELSKELGTYLWKYKLENVLGLSKLLPDLDKWVEWPHEGGTIAYRNQQPSGNGTPTEWAFFVENGLVRWKETKICEEPEGGGHVRKPDS